MRKIILSTIASLVIANSAMAVEPKTYAIINGDKITNQTIAVALKNPNIQFDSLPKETKDKILKQIIDQKVLAQNALKTDAINNPIYKETIKNLKQDLALQVWLQSESKKIVISDKELKNYFNNNKDLFKIAEQFHARHILVKTQDEAQTIINTLKKSTNLKTKFIDLAKSKSIGPSGRNGGDLGFFTPDKMVPEFSKAAKKLNIGEITKTPVKTQFGYHIIYLETKKKASNSPFTQEVKNIIKQKIGQEKLMKKVQQIANKLKLKAKIILK